MASEIKLMLQSDININTNSGNFKLNSGEKNLEGKERFFLSENDEFIINSFQVNIDTEDDSQTIYNNDITLDLLQE